MHRRRCRSAILALGVIASLLVPTTVAAPPAVAATSGSKKVIVQLFEWNWPSVANECTNVLGPKGYGYVQVSPPQEHVNAAPWWVAYQPVSYKIESRKGTRAQFQSMVTTCHNAGVKVIVDTVINHMSGQDNGGTGWAGTSYGHYNYPGTYGSADFHYCGRNGTNDIVNYGDRYEVQNCELVNLSDLKTESDYVRSKIAGYMNDLLSLGVDGFRLDASKHMPAADIAAIKGKLSRSAYIVQEVIYGAGEPIQPTEYTGNGDVHEFRYGKDLARMFNSERLAYLKNFGESWGYLPGSQAVVFTDNHDTQRDGGVLTYRNGGTYALANAFMLAWPYGTPAVMSSYTFSNKDQGPPSDASNKVSNTTCYSGWECEHRWRVIANMVAFNNATQGASVANWYDNGYQHIAFSRAGKGYLSINDEDFAITGRSFYSGLPAGRYCDVIHGDFSNGSCSGPVITVDSSGWFAANINAHDAVAIHIGAKLP